MPPLPPRSRRRGAAGPLARSARRLGEVRRAQLVTTYGVGAMIAIDNESFIVAGIDSWDISEAVQVPELRLPKTLGVSRFLLPPAPDPGTARDGVRARRFPLMYSCPSCRSLQHFRRFNSPSGKAECSDCQEDLVPSRFVVACTDGHLDDFPYWAWVHRKNPSHEGGSCGGELTFRADGSTASLRAVIVGCSCGVGEVSMEGAFRRYALRDLGVRCSGRRPWLKGAPSEFCEQPPRTLQRGSSSVWFPVAHSALSIPPWSEGVHRVVAPHLHKFVDRTEEQIRLFLDMDREILARTPYTADHVVELVEQLRGDDGDEADTSSGRERIYREEYDTLNKTCPETGGPEEQDFVCVPPAVGTGALRDSHGVEQVMLVKRLREVRVLQSFTRVDEPGPTDDARRRAPLALADTDWLPAYEVSGEGVFLRFDGERLAAWEKLPDVVERAARIRARHIEHLRGWTTDPQAVPPTSPVSPRLLLLHTLAHVLINEWSLDGGYPAASLRERLYVDNDMAGILIYTATSDSAGSLGGIVAQGEPARLDASLRSALRRAEWCSNDPLCAEAEASGTDSLNLAACHACVLLPETSCEHNNTLMDRAALIGSPDGGVTGYFRL